MKYQAAKIKKLKKIADFVQKEVKIGKCDKNDIQDIINYLSTMVIPYDEIMTAKQINDAIDGEILRLREDPF